MKSFQYRIILTLIAVFSFGSFVHSAEAQDTSDQAANVSEQALGELDSPRATMFRFLGQINATKSDAKAWKGALQCLDLSEVHPDRAKEKATELLAVINRLGEVLPEHIPDEEQVGATSKKEYQFFPQPGLHDWVRKEVDFTGTIVLKKQSNGAWLFSSTTMVGISSLYRDLEVLNVQYGLDEKDLSASKWVESQMPGSLKIGGLFNLAYWQWLLLLVVIVLGVILDQIVRVLLRRGAQRTLERLGASVSTETIQKAIKPLGMTAMAISWTVFLHLLGLPDTALMILLGAARVFAILATTAAAWRVADIVGEIAEGRAAHTDNKFDDMLIPLLRKTTKVVIVVFGALYLATALNFEVGPLVAALGLGGFGFAFAAKDTIENFFGSIAVLLDRPFDVGDVVSIGGVDGSVEEIGFRSTRIRTFNNSQVTLPNATLVRATVDNFGRREMRRLKCIIGVEYGTTPQQLKAFTAGIRELIQNHPITRKEGYVVHLNEFGPSSLNILMQTFLMTSDWAQELEERERLLLDIMNLADQLGVQFAFPTQTLHLHKSENAPSHTPGTLPGSSEYEFSSSEGTQKAQQILNRQTWYKELPASDPEEKS